VLRSIWSRSGLKPSSQDALALSFDTSLLKSNNYLLTSMPIRCILVNPWLICPNLYLARFRLHIPSPIQHRLTSSTHFPEDFCKEGEIMSAPDALCYREGLRTCEEQNRGAFRLRYGSVWGEARRKRGKTVGITGLGKIRSPLMCPRWTWTNRPRIDDPKLQGISTSLLMGAAE
jgi:hypothetical protein